VYNGGVDLAQVADELYRLDPADFMAGRDEQVRRARDAGEKDLGDAIKKLRRPTVSASLVNRLVREAPDQVDDLLDLGESLRAAQEALAGDELRRLSARRRPVINALTAEAKRLAAESGRTVSDAAEREVEATLEAALADPAAAEAVRSGRLTTALVYAGFGGVDVADAVAVPGALRPAGAARRAAPPGRAKQPAADASRHLTAVPQEHQVAAGGSKAGAGARDGRKAEPGARERRRAERQEAEAAERERRAAEAADLERRKAEAIAQDMRDAEGMAKDAEDGLDEAGRRVAELRDLRQAATRRIEELERQLEHAQAQEAEAARNLRDAERSRDRAARLASEAQRYLARARAKAEATLKGPARRPPP